MRNLWKLHIRISFLASEDDCRDDGFGSSTAIYFLRRSTSKTNQITDCEAQDMLSRTYPPKLLT